MGKIIVSLVSLLAALVIMPPKSLAAEGKLNEWGPFKFGMSPNQFNSLTGGSTLPSADNIYPEYTAITIQNVRLEHAVLSVTARFYKERAFQYDFFTVDAINGIVPSAQASWPTETKMTLYCPNVFPRTLDMLAIAHGKPDEILRPGEFTLHDAPSAKISSAKWWFNDGSRLTLVSTQRTVTPMMCTEFIGMHSGYYDKPYVPEVVPTAK